ncbi:MAG TPA: glucose-6-phosphate isomerase [Armatimonadota bacterium]|jgi:glucose-6-phosphate isomerase
MTKSIFAPEAGLNGSNFEPYAEAITARLAAWEEAQVGRRIWAHDPTVWIADPEQAAHTAELTDRLGWLTSGPEMLAQLDELADFAAQVRASGCREIVLLGMGGSSLAPELYALTFPSSPGAPTLTVLDTTDPAAIAAVAKRLDLSRTLFVVSSKSGGTIETMSLFHFFWEQVAAEDPEPGRHFVAITDPGSSLEVLATERQFRAIFPGPATVGGRYSALTYFGLVPAALIGVPCRYLLERAQEMGRRCGPEVAAAQSPGLVLGAILGELALAGRDKVTFFLSPGVAAFGSWVEQLIAESTGKQGRGIVPVPEEMPARPAAYGEDRLFAYLRVEGDQNAALDEAYAAVEEAGQPCLRIDFRDKYDLGAAFFRWELATAAAGAVLAINPFDQPNVAAAKKKAGELIKQYEETGSLSAPAPRLEEGGLQLFGDVEPGLTRVEAALDAFFALRKEGDYVALMAYLPPTPELHEALSRIRWALRDQLHLATTLGWGPRFLHSTGQLHKGDANRGLFVQITHDPAPELPVPGQPYSFGVLITAQAQGDFEALQENGRRVVRVHLKGDEIAGLAQLYDALPD